MDNQTLNINEFKDDRSFGRMNDPISSSVIKGPCGEEMKFYLDIRNNTIVDVKYYTNGCRNTRTAGQAVADYVKDKKVLEALSVNPSIIINSIKYLPGEGYHCTILAVSTLYRSIANYLLMSGGFV